MPIPAKGNNISGSSQSGGQVVQLVISAKDEASQPITVVGGSINKLKDQTAGLGKAFGDFSKTSIDAFETIGKTVTNLASSILPLLGKSVDVTRISFQKLWDISVKTAGGISALVRGVEDLYSVLSSPPALVVFNIIRENAEQLITQLDSLSNILRNIGAGSGSFFKGFTNGAVLPSGVLQQVDSLIGRVDRLDKTFIDLSRNVKGSVAQTQSLFDSLSVAVGALSGFSEPVEIFESLQSAVGKSASSVLHASQQIFFFTSAMEQLKGVVLGGPFDLLIGQNIRLKEQLLATQATLAATASYSQGGKRVDDPTQSILALAAPLKQVVGQIRKDSLELVGVTSNQLIDSFQLVIQNMTDVNISLKQAGKLSIAFAASLGTLGIPLYQARQEIQSILQGQIDQNSALAKAIGLTNTQVKLWVSQDKVYDRLTERLDAFVKGNKLAARTVGGLVSNIKEIAEETGRIAGDKYLSSIENLIGSVYDYLVKNQTKIQSTAASFLDTLAGAFGELKRSLVEAGESLAPIGASVAKFLSSALIESIHALAKGIDLTVKALDPFLKIMGMVANLAVTNPLFPFFIQLKVLGTGFAIATDFAGKFAKSIPGVMEVLFLLRVRSLPVVNAFSNLSNAFKGNIAAAVTMGAALTNIPGALGLVEKNIKGLLSNLGNAAAAGKALQGVPFFGGSSNLLQSDLVLTALSSTLTKVTPQLLGVAKTGLAIASSFGIGRQELVNLSSSLPTLVGRFSDMVGVVSVFGKEINFKGLAERFSPELEKIGQAGAKAFESIDETIANVTKNAGEQVRQIIIRYGMWAGAVVLVATATSKLVAENENLRLGVKYIVDVVGGFLEKVGRNPNRVGVACV